MQSLSAVYFSRDHLASAIQSHPESCECSSVDILRSDLLNLSMVIAKLEPEFYRAVMHERFNELEVGGILQ